MLPMIPPVINPKVIVSQRDSAAPNQNNQQTMPTVASIAKQANRVPFPAPTPNSPPGLTAVSIPKWSSISHQTGCCPGRPRQRKIAALVHRSAAAPRAASRKYVTARLIGIPDSGSAFRAWRFRLFGGGHFSFVDPFSGHPRGGSGLDGTREFTLECDQESHPG